MTCPTTARRKRPGARDESSPASSLTAALERFAPPARHFVAALLGVLYGCVVLLSLTSPLTSPLAQAAPAPAPAGLEPAGSASPGPSLTRLEQVNRLDLATARQGHPLDLEVTVTYCHPQWRMLYVWGETEGAFITIPPETPDFPPGTLIRIVGRTSAAAGYSAIEPARCTATGRHRRLSAQPWTIQELIEGRANTRWIEVAGKVLGATEQQGRIALYLQVDGKVLTAFALHAPLEEARRWIDAQLQVAGVMTALQGDQGKTIGAALLAQQRDQITVVTPAEKPALDLPLTPIHRVPIATPGPNAARVHIQGVIHNQLTPTQLVVRDPSGSIPVLALFDPGLQLHAAVEVIGFPTLVQGFLALRDAIVLPLPETKSSTNAAGTLPPLDPALPRLESARAVHRLSRQEAAKGYPIRLEAVVTYADPEWWQIFVQDSTDGIYVSSGGRKLDLRSGQKVVVTGRSAPGEFAPVVAESEFSVVGEAPMPIPADATLTELLSGQFDCRWVRLSGLVQLATEQFGRTTVYLRHRDIQIPVMLAPSITPAQASNLVEARITVSGALGSVLNPQGQLNGIRLYAPDLHGIQVDRPPPAHAFAMPTRPIGDLLRYQPEDELQRTKITGIITSLARDGTVSVQDATGGCFVQLVDHSQAPHLWDRVEISGYPSASGSAPTLLDPRWRIVESGSPLTPLRPTPKAILAGQHPSELIRITGRLLEDIRLEPGKMFALQAESVVFEALLLQAPEGTAPRVLRAGSDLEITGVCRVQPTSSGQVRTFQMLLREPPDLRVLRVPPWLTSRSLLWLLGAAGVLGAFTLGWSLLLARKNRELADAEQRVRTILAHVPTGVLVLCPETRTVLDANPVALSLLGLSREALIGQCADHFILGSNTGTEHDDDLALGASHGAERTLVRADGSHLPVLKNAVPVILGGRAQIIESFVDLSERHAAEAALENAKLAAEAASEAKSRFLAMMSHEIRTPLNGVIGMIRLLPRTQLTTRQSHWITMAQTSADTLLRVINDILDFSKIEAGKLDLELRPFDLPRLVTRTAAAFTDRFEARGLTWSMSLDPTAPVYVRGDPDRVAQILGNLLGNALKFTETGGVSLRLIAHPISSDHTCIRFEITDTGIGLNREQISRLFVPFSQVDSSAARRFGGTGLGLGICRQLAELMGGSVGVESEPGRGSTFWFELPFELATGELEPLSPSRLGSPRALAAPHETRSGHPNGRVLLAEDNEINQELAREIITSAGYACDCVSDGHQAIRATREQRYDLVFMDCMMPGLDGYAATEFIRADERPRQASNGNPAPPRLPIIAMTANAMKGDREKCLAAGMDDYLPKPLDPDQVVATLRKWIASAGAPPEADGHGHGGENGEVDRPWLREDTATATSPSREQG